jgi:hypothetical protein
VRFYLGAHQPHWLRLLDLPLMVSRAALSRYKTMPRARTGWMLDSSAFSRLSMDGSWDSVPPTAYVADVRRYQQEIGNLEYAAIQDWMCEPFILAKTGLTLREHQRRTVTSYLALRELAPEVPWMPVLQGWGTSDYLHCAEMYDHAGVDLRRMPLVGVGSICRRQATGAALHILTVLASEGIRLHGFGYKVQGLEKAASVLESADSMAWSYAARREPPLSGCPHANCANCIIYALRWYANVQQIVASHQDRPYQMAFAA